MEPEPLGKALARQIPAGSDSVQVASAVVAMWRDVHAVLSPILGRGGVAAMYRRSLALTARVHPWLRDPGAPAASNDAPDLAALQAALAAQDSATALAAGGASLQAFHELLASLVGPSLTGRLLGAVLESPSRDLPEQDPMS